MLERTSRRAVLAALAATAGCGGVLPGDGSDPDPDTDPGSEPDPAPTTTAGPAALGESRSVGDARVTVRDVLVRDSVFEFFWPDEPSVVAPEDERFIVAWLAVDGTTVPTDALAVRAGDRTWSLGTDGLSRPVLPFTEGLTPAYEPPDSPAGWVATRVPAPLPAAAGAAVTVDGTRWRLPAAATTRLGVPKPTYAVTDRRVPETVSLGTPIEVGATVRNTGPSDGVVRLKVAWDRTDLDGTVSRRVVQPVPAGASRDLRVSIEPPAYGETPGEVPLDLQGTVDLPDTTVTVTAEDGG